MHFIKIAFQKGRNKFENIFNNNSIWLCFIFSLAHPLRVAENYTTHPLHEAQNLMTHPHTFLPVS